MEQDVICEEHICNNNLHATSPSPDKEAEILLTTKKLFSYFFDVQCDKQKKLTIFDITRGSKHRLMRILWDRC